MKEKFIAKGVGAGLVSAQKERGITLIALVITIIVLLILAGITIAMVVGDNGIVTRAKQAKAETEKGEAREKVQIAVAGSYGLEGYDVEKINKELGTDIESLPAVVEQNSYKFTIAKDGNVYDGECLIGVTNKDNYGDYVDYDVDIDGDESNNDWRIFYNDGVNVYLIADDYIEYNMAPAGKAGTTLTENDTSFRLSMNDVINDYEGASDINSQFSKWLSYLNSNKNNTNDNMKEVAYMLDIEVWSTLKNDKAEYAIGAPTLDMFCASYNENNGWTENEEKQLLQLLDTLTKRSIKFALSNVLKSKGQENSILIDWLNQNKQYKAISLSYTYSNSHYQRKQKELPSDEVLIINY